MTWRERLFQLVRLPGRPAIRQGWSRLAGSGEGALVQQSALSGPTPLVIAIMVALTVVAAAGGLSFSNTARTAADELAGGITVQVVEANPQAREAQVRAVVQRLSATPGVVEAHVVSQEKLERLVEPWLGRPTVGGAQIPIPAMVDARLRERVDSETLGALRRSVRMVAPAARVDAQSTWLQPVFAAIDTMRWLAVALVVLLAFATCAAVLLAVRSALGNNRDTIEIVHLLGGSDQQIARIFQRAAAFEAISGGTLGLAAGVAVVFVLGQRFSRLGAGLVDSGALAWVDWLALAAIPLAGVLLAILTARFTVIRALKRML